MKLTLVYYKRNNNQDLNLILTLILMSFYAKRNATWTCQVCQTRLNQDVYPCPVCQNLGKQKLVEQKVSCIVCKQCTYVNQDHLENCQVCGYDLQNFINLLKPIIPQPAQKTEVLTCKSCQKQNDLENNQCVFCEAQLFQSKKKACSICKSDIKEHLFDSHYNDCQSSQKVLLMEQKLMLKNIQEQSLKSSLKELKKQQEQSKQRQECVHCRIKLSSHESKEHITKCRETSMMSYKFNPQTRMTELQTEAIKFMNLKSEIQHNESKPALQLCIKKMGYSIQDLNNLQFYVQNYAPIIIHIHVSKHMEFFVKDTHYRNQFQTNKSSGTLNRQTRMTWEDRMFTLKYSKAKDFQRVKYGVINFTNDPKGVGACLSYGQSYFLLKPHVRERCTFTDKDSSNADSSIATFKYCFRILSKMKEDELRAAFSASKAQEVSSKCVSAYKEIQVHGPIQFSKDIQCIYVNRNEIKDNKKLLDMVYDFSKRFNIKHDFF